MDSFFSKTKKAINFLQTRIQVMNISILKISSKFSTKGKDRLSSIVELVAFHHKLVNQKSLKLLRLILSKES